MTLGENIVRLRTQKNWSQGDLADALDIYGAAEAPLLL